MNIYNKIILSCLTIFLICFQPSVSFADGLKVGFVNFKTCVENSKLGKQEQSNFESMKNQMEEVLGEKEKTLEEISKKLNDADYIDSLSPEAENELKHKFRTFGQEMSQHQQQYYQLLNQANMKIIQNISQSVGEASKLVAKEKNLDVIINDESAFFSSPTLDVSQAVIRAMDSIYKDPKDAATK